ncbi:MAG: hypothetical protein BHV94_05205 [Clostridiales bacterium 59_14]|nr:MAG: hypothetical protein BHV94_05205 [Clostridiales bacterium 59_14]
MTERTIDSREVFRGRIIRVRQDTVRLPNGKESSREVVEHPGGVGILAIDGEDRVVLVRQYRYAFERVLTEIPAGKRETGEEPFLTAQRELKEEIGAEAGRWTELGALIASPGCYGETELVQGHEVRAFFGERKANGDIGQIQQSHGRTSFPCGLIHIV